MAETDAVQNKFWMVWCVNGGVPRYMHWSKQDAEKEAKRLASISPGKTFAVLACVSAFRAEVSPPMRVLVVKNEAAAGSMDREIPF